MGHAHRVLPGVAALLHRVGAAQKMGRSMRLGGLAVGLLAIGSLHASTFYVTVSGLGGEPDYEQRFASQAQEIDKLLHASSGDAKITTLYGPQATKANLQNALGQIARDAKPNDGFVLMLIGHGSFDSYDYKMNLPGPDLSGVELGALLDRIACTRQLVVNMTSASGGSRAALEKTDRKS